MKTICSGLLFLFIIGCSNKNQLSQDEFSFVFATDIHLQPEKGAPEGFKKAIDSINAMNAAFVVTGGDLIMDALDQTYERSDSQYNMYVDMLNLFTIPVYNTIGNHELFGTSDKSDQYILHPEYGENMFEKRLGQSYYTFNYKNWKFFVLNSVENTNNHGYIGMIDSAQINWIKKELSSTDKNSPLAIVTHIPFITSFKQYYYGTTLANDSSLVVTNGKEVLDMFSDHTLKLVLQGHLHIVEEIKIDGTTFITGGAICGKWWSGPRSGFEEGFVKIDVKDDDFTWQYFDYGWDAK